MFLQNKRYFDCCAPDDVKPVSFSSLAYKALLDTYCKWHQEPRDVLWTKVQVVAAFAVSSVSFFNSSLGPNAIEKIGIKNAVTTPQSDQARLVRLFLTAFDGGTSPRRVSTLQFCRRLSYYAHTFNPDVPLELSEEDVSYTGPVDYRNDNIALFMLRTLDRQSFGRFSRSLKTLDIDNASVELLLELSNLRLLENIDLRERVLLHYHQPPVRAVQPNLAEGLAVLRSLPVLRVVRLELEYSFYFGERLSPTGEIIDERKDVVPSRQTVSHLHLTDKFFNHIGDFFEQRRNANNNKLERFTLVGKFDDDVTKNDALRPLIDLCGFFKNFFRMLLSLAHDASRLHHLCIDRIIPRYRSRATKVQLDNALREAVARATAEQQQVGEINDDNSVLSITLPRLRSLHLNNCAWVENLAELLPGFGDLPPLPYFFSTPQVHGSPPRTSSPSPVSPYSNVTLNIRFSGIRTLDLSASWPHVSRLNDKHMIALLRTAPSLEELYIKHTPVTGYFLNSEANGELLPNLRLLDITASHFCDDAVGDGFGRLHSLKHINAGNCEFIGPRYFDHLVPNAANNFASAILTSLDMWNANMRMEEVLPVICTITTLTVLKIDPLCGGGDLSIIGRLVNLKMLGLSVSKDTDEALGYSDSEMLGWKHLRELEQVQLYGFKATDLTVYHEILPCWKKLRWFQLICGGGPSFGSLLYWELRDKLDKLCRESFSWIVECCEIPAMLFL